MKPGKFIGPCDTRFINRKWDKLLTPYEYHASDGYIIRPESDFLTDLGSIPQPLQNLFPAREFKPAYIGHDWLYDTHEVSRQRADYYLNEMIYTLTNGDAVIKRLIIWSAVRLCGWYAWSKADNKALFSN